MQMNPIQLYIAIGLPVIAVLSSMTVSLFQISGLREDIREIRGDIKAINGSVAHIESRLSLIEDRWKIRP
jgi:hypothetical protein